EGEWHVRLRRPYGVGPGEGRRATDKPSRSQPGHEGHGHGRAAVEGRQRTSTGSPTGTTAGSGAASAATNGASPRPASRRGDAARSTAQAPAVGYFTPGPKAASGTRVRAGDTLGTVDVLGVRQDVTAPVDGVVGQTLVESGTAVEYGQELIRLEM